MELSKLWYKDDSLWHSQSMTCTILEMLKYWVLNKFVVHVPTPHICTMFINVIRYCIYMFVCLCITNVYQAFCLGINPVILDFRPIKYLILFYQSTLPLVHVVLFLDFLVKTQYLGSYTYVDYLVYNRKYIIQKYIYNLTCTITNESEPTPGESVVR